jgi:hypothetical protein
MTGGTGADAGWGKWRSGHWRESERCRRLRCSRRPRAGLTGVDAEHRCAMTDDRHAVGAESVQLARNAVEGDDFGVGVARDEEVAVPGFEKVLAGLAGRGGGSI